MARGRRTLTKGCGPALAAALLLVVPRGAAAQVDPSGAWQTWHTEHFRVHAHATLGPLIPHVAAEAERAYRLLASELEPPSGVVDLVLADNLDLANGYATPFPSNRVVIYATPPVATSSLIAYDDWFRLVLTHELTHTFHLDPAHGVWNALRRVFGRAPILFPNTYRPGWVKEGLAAYYESRFSNAGRAHGLFHRQLLAAQATDAWPAPGDLSLVSPKWPAGFGPYAWGTEFFGLESERYGDSVPPRFMRNTTRSLWPFTVDGPLQAAGGAAVDDVWAVLRQAARPAVVADTPSVWERGLRTEPHPALSPDGRRVAYVASTGRSIERLVVRDVASGEVMSHPAQAGPYPAWVADTLFFTQLTLTSPVSVRSELYRWQPGGAWRRLTDGARVDLPFRAAPSGVGVVDLGARAAMLLTYDGAGRPRGTIAAPAADAWGRVALSPDSRRYVGARHHDGQWDLVMWSVGVPEQAVSLTDDPFVDEDPVWSPDGRSVAYASDRTGLPQIYAYDVQTGTTHRVTSAPAGAREPALLADGSVVYTTLFADGFALVRGPAEQAPVGAQLAEALPFLPADSVTVRPGGYRPWPALRPHFWMPYAHIDEPTGTFVGLTTSGSDPIGRTRYAAAAAVAATPLRQEWAALLQHRRWRHTTLDASAEQWWDNTFVAVDTGGGNAIIEFSRRDRQAELGVTFNVRRWRSAGSIRVGADIERIDLFDPDSSGGALLMGPTVIGGVVALSAIRVERPALAISAENGVAASVHLRHRWARSLGASGNELQGSLATYLAVPLPGFAHWVLATRVAGGWSGGDIASTFSLGGVSSDIIQVVPGLSLGGRRAFPLRGFARVGGFTRVTTGTAELRVPILLLSKGMGRLPILVDRVSLTAFGEVGGAWRAGEAADIARYRDVGGEIDLDLALANDLPLQLAFGVAVPLTDGYRTSRYAPRVYLTAGRSF